MNVALLALAAAAAPWQVGSPGAGDPYFPQAGNGGYDVGHYALALDYDQPANFLRGHARIRARATENLRRFNLDLRDFYEVSSVVVDGNKARFEHEGQELSIIPRPKLREGERIVITVDYAGEVEQIVDPDGSSEGWVPTDDGAFVVNEPVGSPGWYPVNDTPLDKATFTFKVTVPAGHTAMANGVLSYRRTHDGKTTWRWHEDSPMAPYLATATNGPFEIDFYEANGLPMYDAVDPDTRASGESAPNPALAWSRLDPQPEIIEFFSQLYGDYPFASGGGIVDWAPGVGYALESQTRPNYHRTPSPGTVVHEIAHQWFGNAVTLSVWPDIWLNEGFATWSEWIYEEQHGGATAQQVFDELYDFWEPGSYLDQPAGDPGGPEHLFSGTVYDRGAMTLQALRDKLGDKAFFQILQAWYADNRYGNVTTADFVTLSEEISGQDLGGFFQTWLYEPGKPATW